MPKRASRNTASKDWGPLAPRDRAVRPDIAVDACDRAERKGGYQRADEDDLSNDDAGHGEEEAEVAEGSLPADEAVHE